MTEIRKISLPIAILMSINIVIGSGFFLSASNLFNITGLLAPLAYFLCGFALLPVIKVFADLSRKYPTAGGIYVYSQKTLGDFWGFISGWGYFIGTMVGNALLLHAFSSMMQQLGFPLPFSSYFSPTTCQLLLDLIFIALFTALNLLNIAFDKIQIGFTILKTIPLGLVLVSMFFLFDFNNLATAPMKGFGLFESMPIVLFAYLGIESCCAIAHQIKSGEKNAARAMIISMGIIISIYTVVMFGLLAITGVSSANPFFDIVPKLTQNPAIIYWGNLLIKISLLSSYLGGFYGAYYANSWNIYALAKEKKELMFSSTLTKMNKFHSPYTSIIFQGVLVAASLFVAFKNPLSLMIMCSFGVMIAYLLTVITYFFSGPQDKSKNIIGALAMLSCIALLIFSFKELADYGVQYLIPFLIILFGGLLFYKKR